MGGTVLSMDQSKKKLPEWGRKWRWFWFAIAILGILQTPWALTSAVKLAESDHRLVFIPLLGLLIRIGLIFMFLWLWWAYRPVRNALPSPPNRKS